MARRHSTLRVDVIHHTGAREARTKSPILKSCTALHRAKWVRAVSFLFTGLMSAAFSITPCSGFSQESRPAADKDAAQALLALKACVDHEAQHSRNAREVEKRAQDILNQCQVEYWGYLKTCTLPGMQLRTCKEVIQIWTQDRLREIGAGEPIEAARNSSPGT
jgi:hypothetical protein